MVKTIILWAMSNVSKLLKGLEKKYKVCSVLSPVSMIGEVLLEIVIPLFMARIIDVGIANGDLSYVLKVGLIMVGLSCLSLLFGALGARFSAVAALGFSRNLRRNLFSKIQDFSFGNLDRFSTSSLVTRLTTDVTNVQNTYQMIIRLCFRAPFMLVSGTVMACVINRNLSVIFFVAIPVLAFFLALIGIKAFPRFSKMMKQYDNMNATVQENLTAIRVVKSFVRTPFENKKFSDSADAVRRAQVNAEKLVIFTSPIMQLVVYSCVILSLWFGGHMVVAGNMQTGELISFITYIGQILMSLMMLSMIFIMLVLSRASISRIVEVLDEDPEIKNPDAEATEEVPDGSIDFKDVRFSYSKREDNCVLSGINLHIDSGQMIGVIGGTGSSKPLWYLLFHGSMMYCLVQ